MHVESSNRRRTHIEIATEVPSALKQLARLIVRGFYALEDVLIIDMLVRNPCMREDDISELLRFEKKQLRARLSVLHADKFLQSRLKMETGPDAKAQKVNYYFINYKIFVNVVKYKLDLMRKRMETEERDATNRASFKCNCCFKTFTDLEADQLFDIQTERFRCTFCSNVVEEDSAALPKKNSRLMLAKFNDHLQILFDLLRSVEGVKLAPELLEPEPVDIDSIRGRLGKARNLPNKSNANPNDRQWTGEATRNTGLHVGETRVNINIGDDAQDTDVKKARERPLWTSKSTILTGDSADAILQEAANAANASGGTNDQQMMELDNYLIGSGLQSAAATNSGSGNNNNNINNSNMNSTHNRKKDMEDVMALLLVNEKNLESKERSQDDSSSDSDTDFERVRPNQPPPKMQVDYDCGYDSMVRDVSSIPINGGIYSIDQLTDEIIKIMTPQEQERFIHLFQSTYGYLFQ